jgi:hypothetical protein
MANEFHPQKTALTEQTLIGELRLHRFSWKTGGAVFGLGVGIAAPLLGSILTAIAWITGPVWHGMSLQRDGTILLFLTIPLLIFGAHCLDLLDRQTDRAQLRSVPGKI